MKITTVEIETVKKFGIMFFYQLTTIKITNLFKGMAAHPAIKQTLILSGKIGIPLLLTYGTVKLGVWGKASDSQQLTSRIRTVLPDASALVGGHQLVSQPREATHKMNLFFRTKDI
jgi:hypothetical protein